LFPKQAAGGVMCKRNGPAEAFSTAIPGVSYGGDGLEMKSRGYWLASADSFPVEIAATLMARYRTDNLKPGDVSISSHCLVGLDVRWLSAARWLCPLMLKSFSLPV
jgi:hypothetical protein